MIFISGPVVVSTDGKIKFQTQLTADQNCFNAKWLKCKRHTKMEIPIDNAKYFIYNISEEIKTQNIWNCWLGRRRRCRISVGIRRIEEQPDKHDCRWYAFSYFVFFILEFQRYLDMLIEYFIPFHMKTNLISDAYV